MNNISKSFKRHIINKNEIINYNEKLLLWNNIIKSHDFYIKNNKDKKGSYSIPCLFKSYINNENIKIIFDTDISEEYKKGIEISVNINACIIVPEFVYNYRTLWNYQVHRAIWLLFIIPKKALNEFYLYRIKFKFFENIIQNILYIFCFYKIYIFLFPNSYLFS